MPRHMTETLAAWASGFDVLSAPTEVQRAAERCIIDVTGVMLAGSTERAITALRTSALEEFAPGPCTLFGSPETGSASAAALVNGAAAHALDFDDTCYHGIVHGSAVVWPAVLAAAQREDASGADALSAFVAGVETEYALGRLLGDALYYKGWWNTAVLGAIGAAAGAARALKLDAVATSHAIAIAACQPAGLRAVFGTTAKPYICGRAAQLGLEAALAARAGLTGPQDAFEAPGGFLEVLHGRASTGLQLEAPGERFSLVSLGIAFKLHPACSATQAAVDACREILRDNELDADDIEEVVCEVTPLVHMSLVYSRPTTVSQAQFSLPFTIGCVIAFGNLSLDHLTAATLRDERLQSAMGRVKMLRSDSLLASASDKQNFPEAARLTVTTRDGRSFRNFKGAALGMPVNPASDEHLHEKFHACAGRAMSREAADRLLTRLQRLFRLTTARDLRMNGTPLAL